jgi:hypothetical protein
MSPVVLVLTLRSIRPAIKKLTPTFPGRGPCEGLAAPPVHQ